MASAQKFLGSDDFRKKQELDEARKAGLAPAEVDEDGKEINPHIPQYMASAPWYLNNNRPSLKHQRAWKEGMKTDEALKRDETYDGKRDRWANFDADEYQKVVDRYARVDEAKKERKRAAQLKRLAAAGGAEDAQKVLDGGEDDEAKLADDEVADIGANVERRVRTAGGGSSGTVRNLRIREDTAKYLHNLDVDSAYYDPKTHAMRQDPRPDLAPHEKTFAGDNAERVTGQAKEIRDMNVYVWEASKRGHEVHSQAIPSHAEMAHKEFRRRKEALQAAQKSSVVDKYGNAGTVKPEDMAVVAQTEHYVEYDRTGKLTRGEEAPAVRSRYEEDVLVNNHTSVWGSWCCVEGGQLVWGYACCHSSVKGSYCLGEAGKSARDGAAQLLEDNLARRGERKALEAAEGGAAAGAGAADFARGKAKWGDDDGGDKQLDADKLDKALREEERRKAEGGGGDERKRGYNVTYDADVTEEEMEAYRMKRQRGDDPMANMAAGGKGEGGYDYV